VDLQKELNGSGGRRPMSVRRLFDLKVNRTVKELVRVVDNESPMASIEAVEVENQSDIRMYIEEKIHVY
jgi:hypothetical protein